MDDRLERTLRDLPRERAAEDFTARALARLDAPRPSRARLPLATAGVAVAAALTVALVAGRLGPADHGEAGRRVTSRRADAAEARRMLEDLRREHRALASELDALAADEPVLYLGSDEEVDLVVDLSRVPMQPMSSVRGAAFAGDRADRR